MKNNNKPELAPGTGAAGGAAHSRGLALMLAALSMLGPFSVDTYLPAFPAIQAALGASPLEVQQTLTAYMLSFALMILWHGALSDAFGRRNVILGALGVFCAASLGCAAAPAISYLWAFRILQGVSAGAGIVIGRAIIRDLHSGSHAARLLSLVTMIFSIAPAIAPILGGWIVKYLGWRTIFLFLALYTASLLAYCYRKLPETLPAAQRHPFNAGALARNYRRVLGAPLFHLKAGTVAFNFAGLFLYISAAPVFVTRHLGLGPDQFGWQFVPTVAGIFLGALSVNRLSAKFPIPKQVVLGFGFLLAASAGNVAYHAFFPPALPWSVLPLLFYTFGMSVVAPGVTLMVLDLFPDIRGIVASCQSFTQTLLAAIVSGVVAPLLSSSVLHLALGQLAFALIACLMWFAGRSYHHSRQGEKLPQA